MSTTINNQQQRVFIALGSNLDGDVGSPLAHIDSAVDALNAHECIRCIMMSKVYVSKPHGPQNQPDYYNAVIEISTTLQPEALLGVLHAIENNHGRRRDIRWGARTLDLDIILYADVCMNTPILTLPHERAHEREFVVQPLIDIDKQLCIPSHGKVTEIVKKLPINHLEIIRDVTTYNH